MIKFIQAMRLPAVVVAGLLLATTAARADETWSLSASSCSNQSGLGNERNCSGVSVWSWTHMTNTGKFTDAASTEWSGGLGVYHSGESSGEPHHALDNYGNTDILGLQFDGLVSLSTVTIGYYAYDSDISLLAYTGTTPLNGKPDIAGKSVAELLASGWEFVGHYMDIHNDAGGMPDSITVNNGGDVSKGAVTSSYWLISAYNSMYSGGSNSVATKEKNGDYIKVLSVAGNTQQPPPHNQVPEPGSLALAGLALTGVLFTRRRRTQSHGIAA